MKRYIKSGVELNPNKYVGGKLSDFEAEAPIERASNICKYIYDFSDGYLICRPGIRLGNGRYDIIPQPVQFNEILGIFESLPIKDGADLIDHQTYLEIIAYCGSRRSVVYLYPISKSREEALLALAYSDVNDKFDYDVQQKIDEDIQRLGVNDEHYILQGWS